MFESRLMAAQFFIATSAVLLLAAGFVLWLGPPVVGLFLLVVQAAGAAIGCGLYADTKGYPLWLGIAVGIGLGAMGSIILLMLPDTTEESYIQEQKRLAAEGMKPSRRRRKDPGYEVLDDDPSPYG
jgi:Na+/melibiose symporter-like transporter